jgi:CheY-like chemotaxis protein
MGKQTDPNPRILIIDDEMQMRFYLKTIVDSLGFEPFLAKNGVQGIEMIKKDLPDVIVLDIMMPEKGGALVYQEIINHPEYCQIPIIFFTGVDKEAFMHHIKMLNATINKPIPEPGIYIAKDADPEYVKQTILSCAIKAMESFRST